jgi:iron donor protein CyaY
MKARNFDISAMILMNELSSQIENQDTNFEVDIEFSNEVLKLEVSGKVFVINKQTPTEEIWLASPISGPYHFSYSSGEWIDKKNNNLRSIIQSEISTLINKKIILK